MLQVRAEGNAVGQGRSLKAAVEAGGGGPGGSWERGTLLGSACHAPECFCLALKNRSPGRG